MRALHIFLLSLALLWANAAVTFAGELPANVTKTPEGRVRVTFGQESRFQFMVTGGRTTQPIGHYVFCRTYRAECAVASQDTAPVVLTESRKRELVEINGFVNRKVRPHPKDEDGQSTDLLVYGVGDYWAYSDDLGDCEDYVLGKRNLLLLTGWPASSLLITVVRQAKGGGHAVLTVRTDVGDLILDNLVDRILFWDRTPYRYLKRVMPGNSGMWESIDDTRDLTKVAATN